MEAVEAAVGVEEAAVERRKRWETRAQVEEVAAREGEEEGHRPVVEAVRESREAEGAEQHQAAVAFLCSHQGNRRP